MSYKFIPIENVTENLYAGDRLPTRDSTKTESIPTVIQAFGGEVKSFYKSKDGLVVTEHETVEEAVKMITDLFGVYSPIMKFIKGVILTPAKNGKKE